MAIATLHTTISKTILMLGVTSLVACGGGGGGGNSKTPSDTTPTAFSFAASTNVDTGAAVVSPSITVSGINEPAMVTITGGEYSIGDGAFTASPGTVSSGQTIKLKVTASSATNTPVEAILSVGGVSATFRATTLVDVTPNAFTFTPATNAAFGSVNTSNPITVESIDVSVPITITGGEYSINGGAFTAAAGTVTKGQTVAVKAIALAGTELTQSAVVIIGGVSGTYSVTTILDTTAPIAEFKFPTPYTLSEALAVKVRGTASDEHAISNVKVVVNGTAEVQATPRAPGDFSSWTAEVPLTANAENEIKVVAMDDRNNVTATDAARKVVIRQRADYSGHFPDTGSPIGATNSLMLDQSKNRLFYTSFNDEYKLFEIDIATGKSGIFANFEQQDLSTFGNGAIDPSFQYAYIPLNGDKAILKLNINDAADFSVHKNAEYGDGSRGAILNNQGDIPKLISLRTDIASNGGIVSTQLDNWSVSVLSDASLGIPNADVPMNDASTIVYDQKHNRYLVASANADALLAIDATTGVRSVFSSESVGTGDPYAAGKNGLIRQVALDAKRNRAIALELYSGNIFAVDLDTSARSIISQMTLLHPTSQQWPDNEKNYIGAQIDTENELLYTVHHRVQALMVVDLQSGQQLILSKAAN